MNTAKAFFINHGPKLLFLVPFLALACLFLALSSCARHAPAAPTSPRERAPAVEAQEKPEEQPKHTEPAEPAEFLVVSQPPPQVKPQQKPAEQPAPSGLSPTPSPPPKTEKLYTPADVSRACAADAQALAKFMPPEELKAIRYLSLTNVPKAQRLTQAGLTNMLVHSLSRKRIIQPIFVGEPESIFVRVNLADFGIDPAQWDKMGDVEPYFHEQVTLAITIEAPLASATTSGESAANAAIAQARKTLTPLVIFVGVPRREIAGAATVSDTDEQWREYFKGPAIVTFSADDAGKMVFRKLPANSDDATIRRTAGITSASNSPAINQGASSGKKDVRDVTTKTRTEIAAAAWLDPQAMSQLITITQSRSPILRADWFAANAMAPPFYYDLLGLKKLDDVKELAIFDARAEKTTLAKATVIFSGEKATPVARNNRILARQSTSLGSYWFTLDFKTSVKNQNVIHNFLTEDFDGSEIIFSLPNGLHGFFLIDGKGNRVDEVPPEIAQDHSSDDRRVRPGRSCISCHASGIQPFLSDFKRTVGAGKLDLGVRDPVLARRIREVFLDPDFDSIVKADQARYNAAVMGASGQSATANAALFRASIEDYEHGLDEPRLIYEAGVPDAQVKLAAAASENGQSNAVLLRRLLSLPIRRDHWEESYAQFMRGILASSSSPK